ncbi:hypothetical protein [Streptococcus thoraltensis]|nr:hypothetical protein [Streptococcus thoraltensis]
MSLTIAQERHSLTKDFGLFVNCGGGLMTKREGDSGVLSSCMFKAMNVL